MFECFINNKDKTLSNDGWSHLKTTRNCYDVGGMSGAAVGALIGGVVGSKITEMLVGGLLGMLINGRFGLSYYICIETVKQFKIEDVWSGFVSYRSTYYVYKGSSPWAEY